MSSPPASATEALHRGEHRLAVRDIAWVSGLAADVDARDFRAFALQGIGDRGADAGAAARHERGFSGELHALLFSGLYDHNTDPKEDAMKRLLFAFLCAFLFAFAVPGAAQTKLRIQSAFPAKGTFADNLVFFAERVKVMSGGRLEIDLPDRLRGARLRRARRNEQEGARRRAFVVGLLGRQEPAAALFGVTPGGPFGMDGFDYMGWLYDGGGLELYREFFQVVLKQNVVPIPMTSAGPQAMGWFKRPVKNWPTEGPQMPPDRDFRRGLLQAPAWRLSTYPGNEILAARRARRHRLRRVGRAQRRHADRLPYGVEAFLHAIAARLSLLEILINGDVWHSLSPDLQAIMQAAAIEATLRSQNRRNRLDAAALVELKTKYGVTRPSHARTTS